MAKTLKEKTITALLWNFIDKFGEKIIFFVIGVILARILDQDDYGLIGMLTIFTVFATILTDSGFSGYLIHKNNVEKIDYSSAFVCNIVISTSIYFILFFSAPYIARFYNQPNLVYLSRVVFLSIPINALGIIQQAMLTKQIKFHVTAKINLIVLAISGTVAITMALNGYGVWALVFQTLITAILRTILLWLNGNWQLSLNFNWKTIKRIVPYSGNILASNIVNVIMNHAPTVAIGKLYKLSQTGNYTQASKFADSTILLPSAIIQNVMFPILSSISNDTERLIRLMRKTIRTLSFLLFPICIGLIVVAKPLIIIILTPKWEAIIPYFQLSCATGVFTALNNINNIFFYVKGYTNIVFRLELVRLFMTLIVLALTIKVSIIQLLIGLIMVRLLCYIINIIFISRKTAYSVHNQLRDIAPYAIISLIIGFIVYTISFFIDNLYILLFIQATVGIVLYVFINKLLSSKIFEEVKELLLNKII